MRSSLIVIIITAVFLCTLSCNTTWYDEGEFEEFPELSISGDRRTQAICDSYLESYEYTNDVSIQELFLEYQVFKANLEKFSLFAIKHKQYQTKGLGINILPMDIKIQALFDRRHMKSKRGQNGSPWLILQNNYYRIVKNKSSSEYQKYYFDGSEINKSVELKDISSLTLGMKNLEDLTDSDIDFNRKKELFDFYKDLEDGFTYNQECTKEIYTTAFLGCPLEKLENLQETPTELRTRTLHSEELNSLELAALRPEVYHILKQANFFLENFTKTISRNDIPFYDESIAIEISENSEKEIFIADCDFEAGIDQDSLKLGAEITVGGDNPILGFGGECRVKIEWKAFKSKAE